MTTASLWISRKLVNGMMLGWIRSVQGFDEVAANPLLIVHALFVLVHKTIVMHNVERYIEGILCLTLPNY